MAPKLRVVVSSPSSAYPPTKPLIVNSGTPTPLKTPHFEGDISVWIKNYEGEGKGGDGDEYFSERESMTYAIVIKGKFTEELDGDQVMWGNVFERPIRDNLPWGTSIATKFMYFVEPTIESDIYADKPFALGPMVATMNYLSIDRPEAEEKNVMVDEHVEINGSELGDGKARKKYFTDISHRKAIDLNDKGLAMEFSNGLLDFNTLSISLPPPFSIQIPLTKYWDGQAVYYVCQKRGPPGQDVFFSVGFQIVDEELRKALESKGGVPDGPTKDDEGDEVKATVDATEEDTKISDDID